MSLADGTSATTSQKMVCQDTCIQYSDSEKQIVAGAPYCPGPDDSGGNRTYQLNKDFVDCTNWTSLQTNDTSTCVSGAQNEPNCGYGANTAQLCGFCNSTSPDPCCAQCESPQNLPIFCRALELMHPHSQRRHANLRVQPRHKLVWRGQQLGRQFG